MRGGGKPAGTASANVDAPSAGDVSVIVVAPLPHPLSTPVATRQSHALSVARVRHRPAQQDPANRPPMSGGTVTSEQS